MIEIKGKIDGVDEVSQRLFRGGEKTRPVIKDVLTAAGEEVVRIAESNAPSRKGRLKRSIKFKVTEDSDSVTMTAKPGKFYGRFVESGVNKVVTVKAHTRRAFGGDVKAGRKRIASGVTFVRSFQRHAHMDAHPFMGPAGEVVEKKIVTEITNAVSKMGI